MNLDLAIESFLAHLAVERGLAPSTVEAYGRDLASLAATTGGVAVAAVDAAAVRRHLDFLARQGISAATRARALSAIAGLLAFLRAEGVLDSDPLADVERPRRGRRVPRVLSIEQVERLIQAPDESPLGIRDRAMLEVLYAGGLRVSELCGLCLGDLELEARVCRVTGKGRRQRLAPLGDPAVARLTRYLEEVRPRWVKHAATDGSTSSPRGTKRENGGESGIRTHGRRITPTHAFQACTFNHSDISPRECSLQVTGSLIG